MGGEARYNFLQWYGPVIIQIKKTGQRRAGQERQDRKERERRETMGRKKREKIIQRICWVSITYDYGHHIMLGFLRGSARLWDLGFNSGINFVLSAVKAPGSSTELPRHSPCDVPS